MTTLTRRGVGLGVAVCTSGVAVAGVLDAEVPQPARTPAMVRPATIELRALRIGLTHITPACFVGSQSKTRATYTLMLSK